MREVRDGIGIVLCLVGLGVMFLAGCATHERLVSQPTIIETPEWRLPESCPNKSCVLPGDIPRSGELVGQDFRVAIISPNEPGRRIFMIQLEFHAAIPHVFLFDPTAVTVRLPAGDLLPAKALPCPYTMHDLGFLHAAPPLTAPMPLDRSTCIKLFIDAPAPPPTAHYSLFLGGVTRAGQRVDLPEIMFRPRMVLEREPIGLFQ